MIGNNMWTGFTPTYEQLVEDAKRIWEETRPIREAGELRRAFEALEDACIEYRQKRVQIARLVRVLRARATVLLAALLLAGCEFGGQAERVSMFEETPVATSGDVTFNIAGPMQEEVLCTVTVDGVFARGPRYTELSCKEYRAEVERMAVAQGEIKVVYPHRPLWWVCWLADPCGCSERLKEVKKR